MDRASASSLIRSIIILPGTVLVFVPGLILWFSRGTSFGAESASPSQIQFWIGLLSLIFGIILAIWTARLQLTIGEGTPAPWDPPKKLVIRGPYRYVRNPMITGVFLILLAESLLFQFWPVAIWMIVFFAANLIYLPLVEEKDLEKRFGQEYLLYKEAVPRWIPKLKPWVEERVE